MSVLHKSDIFPEHPSIVAQTRFVTRDQSGLHSHDFYEAFIVELGSMMHVLNNRPIPMHPFSLAVIYPEDCHEFLQPRQRRSIS